MKNSNYTKDLQPVIASSWFVVDDGTYVYASVKQVADAEKHLQVIRDGNEITVVTDISNLPLAGQYETNKERWKLLNVRCGTPFYCVGFIAFIADTLAREGLDIVITSSFSNDLVMVMENDLALAVEALRAVGFHQGSKE